jgi:hypothetical protein
MTRAEATVLVSLFVFGFSLGQAVAERQGERRQLFDWARKQGDIDAKPALRRV